MGEGSVRRGGSAVGLHTHTHTHNADRETARTQPEIPGAAPTRALRSIVLVTLRVMRVSRARDR